MSAPSPIKNLSLFETQLDDLPPISAGPAMPLTHVTDWVRFLGITRQGNFNPQKPCSVYNEYLVYAFYGRPAYRFKETDLSYHLPSYSPVCFLLKPELMTQAQRMVPFDTGAFQERYNAAMHPALTKEDFELRLDTASPMRVVGSFWNSNRDYYKRQFKPNLAVDPAAEALLHYYNLISNKLAINTDERSTTIEVQLSAPLSLKGNVMAIVVPAAVSDDHVTQIARDLGADWLPYEFEMPYKSNDFYVSVRTVVRSYLEDQNLL